VEANIGRIVEAIVRLTKIGTLKEWHHIMLCVILGEAGKVAVALELNFAVTRLGSRRIQKI